LDYVLLACSHFHMREFVEQPTTDSPHDVGKHLLKFFISGVRSGLATCVAHPFLPCGHMDRFDDIISNISDAEFADAFAVAAEQHVGVEITTGFLPPNHGIPFSIETPTRFLSIAKQAGCRFSFGSDAHNPDQQRRLPELARFVRIIGLTENDLLPVLQNRVPATRPMPTPPGQGR